MSAPMMSVLKATMPESQRMALRSFADIEALAYVEEIVEIFIGVEPPFKLVILKLKGVVEIVLQSHGGEPTIGTQSSVEANPDPNVDANGAEERAEQAAEEERDHAVKT
jgi:hypothetical protein